MKGFSLTLQIEIELLYMYIYSEILQLSIFKKGKKEKRKVINFTE